MTRVFVSHCFEDNYIVEFLVELLKFHHIGVWADGNDLEAGREYTSDIDRALDTCDAMILVVSQHSVDSHWMVREVSRFRAAHPDRPLIPLVLDPAGDPDQVYMGLGLVTQLRLYTDYLETLRKLLALLGRDLFPEVENRKLPDRRSADRRDSGDRRKNPVRRLRVALDDCIENSGRDLLEPIERWRDVGLLIQDLTGPDSPFGAFDFTDKKTGEPATIESDWLNHRAMKSWRAKSNKYDGWGDVAVRKSSENVTGAAYIMDDVIDDIVNLYTVTPKHRRTGERRSDTPRREAADTPPPG